MPNNVQNFLSARAHHLSSHSQSRAAAQETAAHCQEALWLLKCSKEDQRGQNPGWVPNLEGKPKLTAKNPLAPQKQVDLLLKTWRAVSEENKKTIFFCFFWDKTFHKSLFSDFSARRGAVGFVIKHRTLGWQEHEAALVVFKQRVRRQTTHGWIAARRAPSK